jgi:hypothetical protein
VSAANAILDRGYGKARPLEPETIPPADAAEQAAATAAMVEAEFQQLLEESLSAFTAREDERSQWDPRGSEAGALS